MKVLRLLLLSVVGIAITGSALNAQYFSFGKNRVQYQDFEWRYIQSKHFDVYYYGEKNYELAEFAAQSIEAAYMQLEEDFQHQIVDRIPLIVYDSHNDFSQTNVVNLPNSAEGIGGVTDKLKNRMTVPFDGDYTDFRRTLHHELVHAVFNDMFYGGNIQSIIRNNIQLVFPLWFEEGLAEYTALGWDTNTDMFIRDAVINGYLPPIEYLSGYYAYRGGQSLWNFIVEEYGREKISEILNSIKTSRSIEYGFADALGLTMQELNSRWEQSLKERYFPEVAERENTAAIATLMTRRGEYGTYNTSPSISPQGDKIAFITNKRGLFDVIVVDALNGRKLKTVINGEDDPEFEELNILNPNITWSPDGQRIAISTKAKGVDEIALINYQDRAVEKIRFEDLDAIGSISWSPDGSRLAFDGNVGPYQDIYVYHLQTKELTNLTNDFFSDYEPVWGNDSNTIYFTSDRSDKVELNTYKNDYRMLNGLEIYQSDIYRINIGEDKADRISNTPEWDEFQPDITRANRLVYISDENGIQNLYEHDFEQGVAKPITNLQSGVSQFSISKDGSRVAMSSINEGYLDIFLLKSPFSRMKSGNLSNNYWAQRRNSETLTSRVPAIGYARNIYGEGLFSAADRDEKEKEERQEKLKQQEVEDEYQSSGEIDFRNYVFSDEVIEDTTLVLEDEFIFKLEDNITDDGRYAPQEYRLSFSTDVAYSPSVAVNNFGSFALMQFLVSDLLGDHQLAFGSNFQTDLRNSDYSIQYGYLKNRTNWFFNYFHTSRQIQTFGGELFRFRTYGAGVNLQYPIDKFRRIDAGVSFIGLVRDFDQAPVVFGGFNPNQIQIEQSDGRDTDSFFYPQLTYTKDVTLPGFLTPRAGTRYSVGLSGSPGVGRNSPLFASLLGDYRHYINLGFNYSIALRGSGGFSFGPDSQTYFIGGRLGWINQQWFNNSIPFDRLADTFFTLPALPLRGHRFNALYGNKFSLINAEFRFPLFAAIVPGAIPILPLYNVTGAFFFDVGTAWGFNIEQSFTNLSGEEITVSRNPSSLDFSVGSEETRYYDFAEERFVEQPTVNSQRFSFISGGDILIGSGFGLRTIVFGLPLRYDLGWAIAEGGFQPDPIHYISIGIDF